MVAATVTQYQVSPGRREEFIEALGKAKTGAEGRGANVHIRQTAAGGEASGRLSRVLRFENGAARAAFLDQRRERQQPGSLEGVMQAADPPATLVARYWLTELNPQPDGEIPAAPNVLLANSYRFMPGHFAEADAALAAFQSQAESVGQRATIWLLVNAGMNSGVRAVTGGFDSFRALSEFVQRLQERNEGGPGPLTRAVQSGTLELVNQATSTLVEV